MNYCCKCGKSTDKCRCIKMVEIPVKDKMVRKPRKKKNVETE